MATEPADACAARGAPVGGGQTLPAGAHEERLTARDCARVWCQPASVHRWYTTWCAHGREGLRERPKTGRPTRLSEAQWRRLAARLARGAVAAGFDTERWTLRRIATVAEREVGVRYHFRSLGRVLRAHGWSPQRPATRATERNEALIKAWLTRDWPRIKRGLVEAGGSLPSWTKRVSRIGPA